MSNNAKGTVTRSHLTEMIYKEFGYSRAESSDLVDSILKEINSGLAKDGEVKISSFGTFKVKSKKARIGRNPRTKQEVPISARNVVSFYASNILKNRINK